MCNSAERRCITNGQELRQAQLPRNAPVAFRRKGEDGFTQAICIGEHFGSKSRLSDDGLRYETEAGVLVQVGTPPQHHSEVLLWVDLVGLWPMPSA